jgi:hypothetical protein
MKYFRYTIVWAFTLFVVLMGPTLFAQAASAAGVPVNTAGTADEWGNSFLWAMFSSWVIRWWREHPKLSGFTEATALKAQRMIAAAIAFVNGLGITLVFDPDAGTLMVGGLFLTGILQAIRQFLFQEFVYLAALKRTTAEAKVSN